MKILDIAPRIDVEQYLKLKEMVDSCEGWKIFQDLCFVQRTATAELILKGMLKDKDYYRQGGIYYGIDWAENIVKTELERYEKKYNKKEKK